MIKILLLPSRNVGFEIENKKIKIIQNNITSMDTKIHLDFAGEFLKNQSFDYICCMGGIFLPENMQTKSASSLMKEYLISKYNISENKILIEEKSVDSVENIKFMKEILEKNDLNINNIEVTCIAHAIHNVRFKNILKAFGFKNSKFINLHYGLNFKLYLIELVGIILSIFDPLGKNTILEKERNKRKSRELSNILKNYY